MQTEADVLIIGAGLAGLVAAAELAAAGKSVLLLDQEPEQNMGGQAFWSFGGLFLVDSPEQRRMRIRDSYELALSDWLGNADFDRPEDLWPRRWAEAYVGWAAGEKRSWLQQMGIKLFPVVGWAERGGYGARGPGNSVPRFHVAWGTGTGVVAPFSYRVREAVKKGLVTLKFRHRVTELTVKNGVVTGARGEVLEPSAAERGASTSRVVVGDFAFRARAVIVTAGGIGANHELVRRNWPARLGPPPAHMLSGVPEHVDGLMLGITQMAGGHVINEDRMWHYVEGVQNWNPIWPRHGIRILPGPSSLWLDARGCRLPGPLYPGFDTLGTLKHLRQTGYDYSWFILTQKIIRHEFALSGSEQNPDLTNKSWRQTLGRAFGKGAPAPVEAFKQYGADFLVRNTLPELVQAMNELSGENLLDYAQVEQEVRARDLQLDNPFSKDAQITAIRGARNYLGDKLIRTAPPHKLLDPTKGPLIAVRLHVITRKSLGGLETDLSGRVLGSAGQPIPGLYAAGEIAGFGGAACTATGPWKALSWAAACTRAALPARPWPRCWGSAQATYPRAVVSREWLLQHGLAQAGQ
ncbi:FAD-binding dehydrogenase [Hymenobacter cellulosilyticus]|uniref:FAD-binding dehydrogenase n=1 Tax=Hymenobacter cellulosilyticus TaxID=2932248 RepID=A0A8T9Q8X2_9BACT|nr:FAD-binding dehydrogenase [Hymenobacter cellulosilyticus]UOQ72861.1 FAD-binding dehydrogenase [Hymenobacter cellulosilyticus]